MPDDLTRRGFLHGAAAGALVWTLAAQADETAAPAGPAVPLAVIGAGAWGKQILRSLSRQPGAAVKAVCDLSEPARRSGCELVPGAVASDDYRRLLDDPAISAVIVATPSHQHREIVVNALAAGKHVYCEAPLASSIDDARAVAQSARGASGIFQSGLQLRCSPLYQHALKFVRASYPGNLVSARAQWHQKQNWRRAAEPEREQALNWRIRKESSGGLLAEVGIHQLDYVTWMLKKPPLKVRGFGETRHWRDEGLEIPDTVNCWFDYPKGVRLAYDATLASSYGGVHELLVGSDGTILTKGTRAWLFKESDAPTYGWEVYARQDKVGDEQGIVLIANSTKLLEAHLEPSKVGNEEGKDALYAALEAFCQAIRTGEGSPVDAKRGFEATVVALKAHEAVTSGTELALDPTLFDLDQ